nr:2-phospho-L-lactate transferase CofD family protein [Candidatus Dormibacteraeota bacterium]
GLHLSRTGWLRAGVTLTEATRRLGKATGLRVRLLPCTDSLLRTMLQTDAGTLSFQEYFVRRAHTDDVHGVEFAGAATAAPAPGVIDALSHASAVNLAPSNPIISIGPILAVAEIRETLAQRSVSCVAVSPIVAGTAIKGPAAAMLRSLGYEVSPVGVAELYAGLIDGMVIDSQDAHHADAIEQRGVAVTVTDTIMHDQHSRVGLARATIAAAMTSAVR